MVLFETKVVCGAMRPFSTKMLSVWCLSWIQISNPGWPGRPSLKPPKCIQLNHIQKNTRKYSWFSLPTPIGVFLGRPFLRSSIKWKELLSRFQLLEILETSEPRTISKRLFDVTGRSVIDKHRTTNIHAYIYIYNIIIIYIYIRIYIVPPQDLHFKQISH